MLNWLGDAAQDQFWWYAVIGFLVAIGIETFRPERSLSFPALRWFNHILLFAACIGSAVVIEPLELLAVHAASGAPTPFAMLRTEFGDLAVLAAGVLALDLVVYLLHRAQHAVPVLWRFHAVHHSDTEVDASTALRHHPVAYAMVALVVGLLLPLFGMPLSVFPVYGVILFISALLQHLNVRLPLSVERALQLVLVCQGMHRVHHSRAPQHQNVNFGSVFSVWDRVLGTYMSVSTLERDKISFGIGIGLDQTTGLWSAWALPFTRFPIGQVARLRSSIGTVKGSHQSVGYGDDTIAE